MLSVWKSQIGDHDGQLDLLNGLSARHRLIGPSVHQSAISDLYRLITYNIEKMYR